MKYLAFALTILAAGPLASVFAEEDPGARIVPYPFPAIEEVPERNLIQADQNRNPSISPRNKPRVAELAASADTPENLRFYSIWGLAISGHSPESAEALAKVAEDATLSRTTRVYAAMGLRNFTGQLGKDEKEKLRLRLRKLVENETTKCPDGIFRTLLAWEDAPWIVETLGDSLVDHPIEVEVLGYLPKDESLPRLVANYLKTPPEPTAEAYNRRAAVGRILTKHGEKGGIDILATLLPAESVPLIDGEPNHQYRHNVFSAIQAAVKKDFGYGHLNYHPSIDEAIERFEKWWVENGDLSKDDQ